MRGLGGSCFAQTIDLRPVRETALSNHSSNSEHPQPASTRSLILDELGSRYASSFPGGSEKYRMAKGIPRRTTITRATW
jgi:hypothetical protein